MHALFSVFRFLSFHMIKNILPWQRWCRLSSEIMSILLSFKKNAHILFCAFKENKRKNNSHPRPENDEEIKSPHIPDDSTRLLPMLSLYCRSLLRRALTQDPHLALSSHAWCMPSISPSLWATMLAPSQGWCCATSSPLVHLSFPGPSDQLHSLGKKSIL